MQMTFNNINVLCSIFVMQKNKKNPPPNKKSKVSLKANETILLSRMATLSLKEGATVHILVSPSSLSLKCQVNRETRSRSTLCAAVCWWHSPSAALQFDFALLWYFKGLLLAKKGKRFTVCFSHITWLLKCSRSVHLKTMSRWGGRS